MAQSVTVLSVLLLLATMQTHTEDWNDADRDRTVPVRVFEPDGEQTKPPYPAVLLSHGLGGSREGFGYLGEYWSQHGYIVIVMQHHGSDSQVRTERRAGETPLEALNRGVNVQSARDRAGDVRFVLDELPKRFKEKADLQRIGIGGHSFGSHTTFAAAGRLPFSADKRLKAAIAMSPNVPNGFNPAVIHRNINIPVLHLTGTKDSSPIDKQFKPEERRIPFDSIRGTEQYLVIFKDGNHMLFSGHRRMFGLSDLEKKYQPVIAEITCRFLDAYLKEDAEAKSWLKKTGLTDLMKDIGSVEKKEK